ncbi:MAG: hypothetical protein V2I27_09400 [Erythrobacter sp.]|jgi:hypothetical protein|nr:hypothetical protein [Erythrobacter sp.]
MIETPASTAPAFNAFRLIDDGKRLAIHCVAIDDAGAVIAFDPEPARLEVPSGGMIARWRITGDAFGAANCAASTAPVLLLRNGQLIELPEDGEPIDESKVAVAA